MQTPRGAILSLPSRDYSECSRLPLKNPSTRGRGLIRSGLNGCAFISGMPSFDDVDSGLESLTTMDSKDNSPKKAELNDDDELDMDADEDLEESLAERIWGLTEMFPQVIRNSIWLMTTGSMSGIKNLYGFSRNAMWVFFSSSAILMAPVIFEVERAQMEEMQKQQQRQILLGPNAAVSGGMPSMGMPMPVPPTQPR